MSQNPTPAPAHDCHPDVNSCEDGTAAAIIGLLLAGDYHGPWTRTEIERELGSSPLVVADALAYLRAAGLIHVHAEFVFSTHAARRMDALEL